MGFTKLDEGIVFSSIMAEDDSVFKVFTIFMATCKSNGISPVSPVFISSITKKPIDEIMRCIKILESPDPLSRSTTEDGVRIKKVDGGYFLINYKKYRDYTYSDNSEAVRKREYRKKKDIAGHVPDIEKCPDISASASVSASASASGEGDVGGDPVVDEIYALYPSRDKNNDGRCTGKCSKDKKKIAVILKTKTKEELIKLINNYLTECTRTKTYLKNFSVFLNQLPEIPDQEPQKPVFSGAPREYMA